VHADVHTDVRRSVSTCSCRQRGTCSCIEIRHWQSRHLVRRWNFLFDLWVLTGLGLKETALVDQSADAQTRSVNAVVQVYRHKMRL